MAPKRASGEPETPPAGELSAALAELNQAAQSLAASTSEITQTMRKMLEKPADGTGEPAPTPAPRQAATGTPEPDEEARRFYERLEQTGQLVDVEEKTDLSTLPPHITHIRRPDGSIQRIGFS